MKGLQLRYCVDIFLASKDRWYTCALTHDARAMADVEATTHRNVGYRARVEARWVPA